MGKLTVIVLKMDGVTDLGLPTAGQWLLAF